MTIEKRDKLIESVESFLDFIEPMAKRNIAENAGHSPMAFVILDKELSIVLFAGELDEDHKKAIRSLFTMSALAGASLLGFVSEGWLARGEKANEHWRTHGTFENYVVEDKGEIITRQEVLLLSVASPKELRMRTYPIIRNGDTALLGNASMMKNEFTVVSRFLSNLPWKETLGDSEGATNLSRAAALAFSVLKQKGNEEKT